MHIQANQVPHMVPAHPDDSVPEALFSGRASALATAVVAHALTEIIDQYNIAQVRNDGPEGGQLGYALEYATIIGYGRDISACRAATKAILLSILRREAEKGRRIKRPGDHDVDPGKFDNSFLEIKDAHEPVVAAVRPHSETLSVRVDAATKTLLEKEASRRRQPVSKVAREAMQKGLKL